MVWVCFERQTYAFPSSNKPYCRKNQIYPFSCAIVHGYLVIYDPDLFFAILFHGRLLQPYLYCELVSRDKQMHFQVQTSPNAGKTEFIDFLMQFSTYFLWYMISTFYWSKFFIDVCYNLINGASWSRGVKKFIFNFKWALMGENSSLIFGDIWYRIVFSQRFLWTSIMTLFLEMSTSWG